MKRAPSRTVTPGVAPTSTIGELLAIDPGIVHPAAARFRDGKLVAARRTPNSALWAHLQMGQRCLEIATAIVNWWDSIIDVAPSHVVIEWPKIYRETKAKGVDPNDLPPLVGVAMCVVGILATRNAELVVLSPKPDEVWQRLPKSTDGDPWASTRGQRIKSRLSAAEFAAVIPSHDAVDAAGLGLWVLGRFERARVFPGATP